MENVLFPSLYEEDFIIRSLGSIVTQPDVALTELVANAWDAGASNVTISIPEETGHLLYIEDDGIGMSESEFQHHWMTLRYNRLKEQGRNVKFPSGEKSNRLAFGRNGVGRHGLFCFGNEYKVITEKDGKKLTLKIKPNVGSQPFAVVEKEECISTKNGTRLEVIVTKNLPNIDKITEILSARFLHDPQFTITVNHRTLNLEDLTGETEPAEMDIEGTNIHLTAYFVDTTKAGRKSIFQGIAFWQSGRLVGEPSWSLGKNLILDGRTSLAKRYTFIVKSNDLSEYIKEDWSGFKTSDEIEKVYQAVEEFVNNSLESVSFATISNVTENLDITIKQSLKKVNPLVREEVKCTIAEIVKTNPKVRQESVNLVATRYTIL